MHRQLHEDTDITGGKATSSSLGYIPYVSSYIRYVSTEEGHDMSDALKAIEEDRHTVLALCKQWPASLWAKDSGCAGWSVQDLLSHMACSFWLAVDPSHLPDPGGLPAERAADLYVESRASMTPEELVARYG